VLARKMGKRFVWITTVASGIVLEAFIFRIKEMKDRRNKLEEELYKEWRRLDFYAVLGAILSIITLLLTLLRFII